MNEEYLPFPVGIHPDMLDALARIVDEEFEAAFPLLGPCGSFEPEWD